MIRFDSHPECTLCPLHQSATNPGLPTRSLYDGQPIVRDRALLFVGQSPGHHEDKKAKSFVGYTGQLLGKMVKVAKLSDYCDIYLANACRCKPPQGADEAQAQVRKCRDFLVEDVTRLQAAYKEVIIMALGAKACYATLHITSLNEALKKQAKKSHLFGPEQEGPRVFSTFHPANLHPLREPGKIKAVEAHFSLLLRYLEGRFIPNELNVVPELFADVPDKLPPIVSLDIETYGILQGKEQTVFHPIKSKEIDGVDFDKQIVTVSFSWYESSRLRSAQYVWENYAHRRKIREWFRRISSNRIICIGQNIKFDLLYLKMSHDPELGYWIDPRRLIVDDTMIWSFLYYEQQPEKGLKELSTLYGIYDYTQLTVLSKSGNAKSPWDKDLHLLNCTDSAATLRLRLDLEEMIRDRYGKDSSKLSDICSWMRNLLIWDTLELEMNGSAFNIPKLTVFHKQEEKACKRLFETAEVDYGIKLAGPGSDAPLRQLMLDCLDEAGLISDNRVEWSGKTKKISIGVENVNLVKSVLHNGRNADVLSLFQEFKERHKITTTYTGPLLSDERKGIVLRSGSTGISFPSWYPVPTYADRGGSQDDKTGGQIQGRISCKKPARQTEPRDIRECSCSRFPGGKLIEYDVNQDHLRMAALLSGDPLLMEAYQKKGENIHTRTALTIFPEADPTDPGWKKTDMYKLGKTLNFLVLFRGGAAAFQRTALEDANVEVDIEFCDLAIKTWYAKHHTYKKWQDSMIDLAAKQGYLVLPTGWSRTFGLGHQNVAGQTGEICNFLHQTPCAQLLHSIQWKVQLQFLKYHLRSLICLQIYDALFNDIYPGEEGDVNEIMHEAMIHPPLLPVFERWVGRSIPWGYERKEYK